MDWTKKSETTLLVALIMSAAGAIYFVGTGGLGWAASLLGLNIMPTGRQPQREDAAMSEQLPLIQQPLPPVLNGPQPRILKESLQQETLVVPQQQTAI